MSTLQERIKDALAAAGMKPAELARQSGVSRATVSLWVNGPTATLEGDNLTRAAAALGVDPHWLSTGERSTKSVKDTPPARAREDRAHYQPEDELRLLKAYRNLRSDQQATLLAFLEAMAQPGIDLKMPMPRVKNPDLVTHKK